MKSHLDIAKEAIELVTPSIHKLFEQTNRQELHIVIMDPRVKPWESTFEESILFEASLGTPDKWTIPFDDFARKKALQAWRNNQPNLINQSQHT